MFFWSLDGSEIAGCDFNEGPDKTPEVSHFVVDVKTKEKKPHKIPGDHFLTDWSQDGKLQLRQCLILSTGGEPLRVMLP